MKRIVRATWIGSLITGGITAFAAVMIFVPTFGFLYVFLYPGFMVMYGIEGDDIGLESMPWAILISLLFNGGCGAVAGFVFGVVRELRHPTAAAASRRPGVGGRPLNMCEHAVRRFQRDDPGLPRGLPPRRVNSTPASAGCRLFLLSAFWFLISAVSRLPLHLPVCINHLLDFIRLGDVFHHNFHAVLSCGIDADGADAEDAFH